ncbi:MAG TPA: hypothetical protein VM324_01125 [Egibacteraceae bacterium]|nr:hypothetical protein [Egibacteraceae bacterium]
MAPTRAAKTQPPGEAADGARARAPQPVPPAASGSPAAQPMGVAMVLLLQRAAGNRAVAEALRPRGDAAGSPAVVQRKNAVDALTSIGRGGGLRPESYHEYGDKEIPDPKDKAKKISVPVPTGRVLVTKRRLVTGAGAGDAVRVFSETAPRVEGRLAALQQAAGHNAAVGQGIDAYALSVGFGPDEPNRKWTRDPARFDRDDVPTVDPFFYEITAPFTLGGERHVLDLLYQHAAAFTGYVEGIYDSSNTGGEFSSFASMRDRNETVRGATSEADVRNPKYTNVHDQDLTSTSPKLIDLTSGRDEKNIDAYTKIAGEGARWQAVRAHASNLKDTSVFFTAAPGDPTRVLGITFKQLWLSWKEHFEKAYGIPDSAVVAKLKAGMGRTYPRWDLRETRDYDLHTGASYRLPYDCIRSQGEDVAADTYFYTADRRPGRRGQWGVTAATLWRGWGPVFSFAPAVTDKAVADAVWGYQFGDRSSHALAARDLRRGDYDLDAGGS